MSIESAIESAIENVEEPTEVLVESPTDTPEESSKTVIETPQDAPEGEISSDVDPNPTGDAVVASPAAKTGEVVPPDEFEKKFGVPATASGGRENRIPYSRVKKIVEKQAKEVEASFLPKITELEGKVKERDDRLSKVDEFRNVLLNEPQKFMDMLRDLPQYKTLLDGLQAPLVTPPVVPLGDDMPLPDEVAADGSKSYSMNGIRAFSEWTRAQARKDTLEEVRKIYGPIQEEWKAQQQLQQIVPVIQKQISEARQWPLFNESEEDIVKALQSNPQMTLETAYRTVVYPKLATDRNKMREDLLKELKKAPASTSAPASGTKSKPVSSGPRSLESIIEEQIATLPQR